MIFLFQEMFFAKKKGGVRGKCNVVATCLLQRNCKSLYVVSLHMFIPGGALIRA